VGQGTAARARAVLLALFVTLLWSASWVLIKIGLEDIPALTFAGLRYTLASLCLLPFALGREARQALRRLERGDWSRLILLALLYYTLTQGAQFLGLAYLPAMTVSLMFNFTPVAVTALGILLLNEWPGRWQWLGIGLNLVGLMIYFYPVTFAGEQALGLAIMTVGVLTNAGGAVLGRRINRDGRIPVILVTVISMGLGSLVMLAAGIAWQGMPALTLRSWGLIALLAVFNTALAFSLWNYALRTLSAMEASILNGTMLVQIALLAWLFLGETPGPRQIVGLVVAGGAALLVQLSGRRA